MPEGPGIEELARAEARLVELEVRYTHHQKLLRELNDVVYQQHQEIAGLKERLVALEQRLVGFSDSEPPTDPSDEVPPHY
jgi:uncharacterized coiled-coil protein SlyX